MMDLAGKAYDAPAYQLAGGKFRDNIRIYCDTHGHSAEDTAQRLKGRMEQGFTFLKMDVGINICRRKSLAAWGLAAISGEISFRATSLPVGIRRAL